MSSRLASRATCDTSSRYCWGDADTSGPAAAGERKPAGLGMRELVAWVGDNVAALLERKIPQTGGAPYWCRRW